MYFEFSNKYRELTIWSIVFLLLISLPIRFYFLQYATLNGCEYETLLEFDEQAELTIKLDDSDENGNEQATSEGE